MAIAHPAQRLVGVVRQNVGVGLHGLIVPANAHEGRRAQVAIDRMPRIAPQQQVGLGQRLGGLAQPVQGQGVAVAHAGELGRQLQRLGEQPLGVPVPSGPGRHLAQQGHRGHVGGPLRQDRAQDLGGDGEAAVHQGVGGRRQVRVGDRGPQVAGMGVVRAGAVACEPQPVAERAPSRGAAGCRAQEAS